MRKQNYVKHGAQYFYAKRSLIQARHWTLTFVRNSLVDGILRRMIRIKIIQIKLTFSRNEQE